MSCRVLFAVLFLDLSLQVHTMKTTLRNRNSYCSVFLLEFSSYLLLLIIP